MKIQEFYKDGQVYDFEMSRLYVEDKEKGFQNREEVLIADGYMPVFDKRTLHYETGKGGSLILENDFIPPRELTDFQDLLKGEFSKTHKTIYISTPRSFYRDQSIIERPCS